MTWPALEDDEQFSPADDCHNGCYEAWAMGERQPPRIDEVLDTSWEAVDAAVAALRAVSRRSGHPWLLPGARR